MAISASRSSRASRSFHWCWPGSAVSAQIVFIAVLIASLIAVPAGVIAAWRQNSLTDLALVGTATVLLSIPTFWLGLLLLLFFGLKLGWLPVLGYVSIGDNLDGGLLYLVLPVMTLVIHEMGVLIRMARASTLEVLRLDYITHARAKGLSESAVLWRHAFKNAFGPTWTMIGLILGNLLGGIAVIETVFTIPGLGRLIVDSIFQRDYPVIQGCLLFVAFVLCARQPDRRPALSPLRSACGGRMKNFTFNGLIGGILIAASARRRAAPACSGRRSTR